MTGGFAWLARLALFLALGVVVLGAWVRLTDAGLGCPDWPGCYGQLLVPDAAEVETANRVYPGRPVEQGKAWREMIHRYFAGVLGLIVLALAAIAWRRRREAGQPVALPSVLLGLVTVQALLGMWTVTLLLKPAIVTGHLLGGMATLALLAWLALETVYPGRRPDPAAGRAKVLGTIALAVVSVQIALGGWTSTNYAALACPDFPTCQLQWWPEADFGEGFVLWRGIGVDYEGGVLEHPARVAIHLVHRIGALATLLVVGGIGLVLLAREPRRAVRLAAGAVLAALALQIVIGISVVVKALPLPVAVAHNAGAALLLLAVVTLNFAARRPPAPIGAPAGGGGSATADSTGGPGDRSQVYSHKPGSDRAPERGKIAGAGAGSNPGRSMPGNGVAFRAAAR